MRLALWSCSWGRIQCTAETPECKEYESWAGDSRDKISVDLIIKAFELIGEQLPDNQERTGESDE